MSRWTTAIRDGITIYADRRIILIALMGLSSGLPYLLSAGTLAYWMRAVGVDLTTIGLFALVALPYSFKFVWAPIIDKLPLPLFTSVLGQRRGWALACQIGLFAAIAFYGYTDPVSTPGLTAFVALTIAFLSASQDIVIDALRIELLKENEQGAGAASSQAGYRVGIYIAGAGVLFMSDYLTWELIFLIVSMVIPLGMMAVLLAREPQAETRQQSTTFKSFVRDGVIAPYLEFLKRPAPWAILLFVLFYKFGDAISGYMANPFYFDMGYTGTQIGSISKTWGLVATVIGVFAGGSLVRVMGLIPALIIGGIFQAATNVMFAILAISEPTVGMLAAAVWSDNFAGGIGSAAFVAYLSALCSRDFTATQYALLTSFMSLGRTLFAAPGGYLAETLGYFDFFLLSTFLAIPGLVLILYLRRYNGGLPSGK